MESVDLGEGGDVHRKAPIGEDHAEHDYSLCKCLSAADGEKNHAPTSVNCWIEHRVRRFGRGKKDGEQ